MAEFDKIYRFDVLFLPFFLFLSSVSFAGQVSVSKDSVVPSSGERLYESEIFQGDAYASIESHLSERYQADRLNPKWPYLLSILYVEMRNSLDDSNNYYLSSAATMARQSFDLNQNSPFGYIALSNLLNEVKQSEKALRLLSKVSEITSVDSRWRIAFFEAKILAGLAQFDDSFAKVRVLMSSSDRQAFELGEILCEVVCLKQNFVVATKFLDSWSHEHSSPRIEVVRAKHYLSEGKWADARNVLLSANKKFSVNEYNLNMLAHNLVHQSPYAPDVAIKLLESSKDSAVNGSRSSKLESNRRLVLGRAYLVKGDFKSAEKEYLSALTDSENISRIGLIVDSYKEQAAVDYGLKFLQKAIEDNPGVASLHALQGELFADYLGSLQSAEESYLDAITLVPNESEYFNSLGLVYYRMKKFNSALSSFSVATRINPTDATSFYNLACLHALVGERDSAMIALERALTLSPSLQVLAVKDQDLVGLHALPKFDSLTSRSLSH